MLTEMPSSQVAGEACGGLEPPSAGWTALFLQEILLSAAP